jgi:hypothetical protein
MAEQGADDPGAKNNFMTSSSFSFNGERVH